MFDFLFESVGWLLKLCYSVMFENYVLALLLFALLVKIILLPLGIKQHSNSLKQARLRPLEAAIVKKYNGRNDRASQQKRQMEIQTVQQKAGYSQLAGCLPLFIQLPVIMLIYNVIRKPLSYIAGFSDKVITALGKIKVGTKAVGSDDQIKLLGAMRKNPELYFEKAGAKSADALLETLPNFSFFGFESVNLADTPTLGINLLVFVPILTFIITFCTSKLTKKLSYQSPVMQQSADGDAKISMTIMELMMPLISTWITLTVPAVIGIYWMYQNLIGVLQQFIMVKIRPYPVFTEEDYKEAERAVLGKKKKNKRGLNFNKNPDAPRVPSLHHIDDDEYNEKVVVPQKEKTPVPKEGKNLNVGKRKD